MLLKIYFLGLLFHVAFSSVPGLAFRLSVFFLVVEVLIPMMIDVFKSKWVGYFADAIILSTFLAFSLRYTKHLNPYYINQAIM